MSFSKAAGCAVNVVSGFGCSTPCKVTFNAMGIPKKKATPVAGRGLSFKRGAKAQ